MINESSYASAVAEELDLDNVSYAEDVTNEADLDNTAYAEDVATAINEGGGGSGDDDNYTLRVCQYNVGHFNMGRAAGNINMIGNTGSPYNTWANNDYDTQLARWKSRISSIDADLIGAPEWNSYFGWKNGSKVAIEDAGIFDGYNISRGKDACSYWWINALLCRYEMSNLQDIELGSSVAAKAYVRVGTITLDGKQVKIAVTHLNWNQTTGYYESRLHELRELVKLFQNDEYLILCGDFNTEGSVGGTTTAWEGLQEFDIFKNGFTEEGVTYHGGFTLANSTTTPLLTANATNSRPDLAASRNHPYMYLDNIIVKGFSMSNVQVVDDGTITDHCAVVADLTIL